MLSTNCNCTDIRKQFGIWSSAGCVIPVVSRNWVSVMLPAEGLFDLASLWQAGFRNTTSAIGTNLTPLQFRQLCERLDRPVYIVFDQDENQAGQRAARQLAHRLVRAGIPARVVQLPAGHDPNSYFVAGATADDFTRCLEEAQSS
jgi:DNA primase